MRAFVTSLVSITIATSGIAIAAPIEMPNLGTKRRVLMAKTRRTGNPIVNQDSGQMVIEGAPKGITGAARTQFFFDDLALDSYDVIFDSAKTAKDRAALLNRLKQTLTSHYGAPWFVRDDVASLYGEVGAQNSEEYAVTWNTFNEVVQLRGTLNGSNPIVVTVRKGDAPTLAAENESKLQDSLMTETKKATEALFYELGNQPFIAEAAKTQQKAVRMKLARVRVSKSLAIDSGVLSQKFVQFAKGHWDIDMVDGNRKSDLDIVIDVTPVMKRGQKLVAISLRAKARSPGKRRARVVYSAQKILEPTQITKTATALR